jgi:hypothetical protein
MERRNTSPDEANTRAVMKPNDSDGFTKLTLGWVFLHVKHCASATNA